MGVGNNWVATAYPDRFRFVYDRDRDYLPANWQDRNSNAGWDQFSSYIMAHEVVHAVGGRHTRQFPVTLMSPAGYWGWLNLNVAPVSPATSIEVRHLLLQWYPGNVGN